MWAKIITIKRTKDLNYFSLCALNLFNTRVSQFELNYWNKLTFTWHSNLLRCTCMSVSFWSLFSTRHTQEKPSHYPLLCETGSVFFTRSNSSLSGNALVRSPASILELKLEILYVRISLRESCWWVTQVWHNFSLVLHSKWFPLSSLHATRWLIHDAF